MRGFAPAARRPGLNVRNPNQTPPDSAPDSEPRPPLIARIFKAAWRGFLIYLEILGLRKSANGDPHARVSSFKLMHTEFRKLLKANNDFLENISVMEDELAVARNFDTSKFLRRSVTSVISVHHLINSINAIAPEKYGKLDPVYNGIAAEIDAALKQLTTETPAALIIDGADIDINSAGVAGSKTANLYSIRGKLGLPVPDGFAVTTEACRLFFNEAGLMSLVQMTLTSSLLQDEDHVELIGEIQERIRRADVPEAIARALYDGYDRLAARTGRQPRLAVRSSAIKEDTSLSFAGQYTTVLNVTRDTLMDAYLEVVASFFSLEATYYRRHHGLTDEPPLMAVGCIEMIDAAASGILFSEDPNNTDAGNMLIQAVRGLGVPLAEGMSSPETVVLERSPVPRVARRARGAQETMMVCDSGAGVAEKKLSADADGPAVLGDADAEQLGRWALELEKFFGGPQDIEWAVDQRGDMFVLQSRPLRLVQNAPREEAQPVEGAALLLRGGETACPGIGGGPACFILHDSDLDGFPDGGVLVAIHSSPKYVRVMAKARAIITDMGSTTGHMAALSREFRIPTLLHTKTATQTIPRGAPVTVDATNGFVYAGILPGADQAAADAPAALHAQAVGDWPHLPEQAKKAAALIIPLNLINPHAADFTVENCRTLHDLTRFIHEKAYAEMFLMGQTLGDSRAISYVLDLFLPMDLYIIDIGGGIIAPEKGRRVKPRHISCIPLTAILKGMTHPKVVRFGPRPIDAGGLFSLMMRHALTSPENDRTFADPCYAIVSGRYLNYTARVGYHFGIVDTYCSDTINSNYINILFRGGAADAIRRRRRAAVISNILKAYGFSTLVNGDTVTASLSKVTSEEISERLDIVGRLLQFMRQMDVAMTSDDMSETIFQAFMDEDYSLERVFGPRK